MKNIIITGACGLVATELAYTLLQRTDAQLYLLSTQVENLRVRYEDFKERVSCHTLLSFADFAIKSDIKYDVCIHTAFSRSSDGKLIVESIEYQRNLIDLIKHLNVEVFANISSQSVYGKSSEPLWTEETRLDPDYLYAMGKCFSEVLTMQMLDGSNIKWTNLRLCSVCENARFVRVFVQNAINGEPIVLTAPEQQCSFIDVQDIADGLVAFIDNVKNVELAHVYNFGANLVNSIREIAFMVKAIAENNYGFKDVAIVEKASVNQVRMGMDATSLLTPFGWQPVRTMNDRIVDMFELVIKPNRGGGIRIVLK